MRRASKKYTVNVLHEPSNRMQISRAYRITVLQYSFVNRCTLLSSADYVNQIISQPAKMQQRKYNKAS